MTKKSKNIIKTVVIILFLVLGAFEGVIFYIGSQINPELYQQQLLEAVKAQTGREIKVGGVTKFKLFPTPKLILSKLEVSTSEERDYLVPKFSIEQVEISLSVASLLSSQFKLSSVTLVQPVLSVATSSDNVIHWDWLSADLVRSLNIKSESGVAVPLLIRAGVVNYSDVVNNKNFTVENIEAYTTYGTHVSLSGRLQILGRDVGFTVDSKKADLPVGDSQLPVNLNIGDGADNMLQVQSVVDMAADNLTVAGKFKLSTADLLVWADPSQSSNQNNNQKNSNADPAGEVAMPLEADGAWGLESGEVRMKDVAVKGLNSQGSGSINVGFDNWRPIISTELNFEYMDYLAWKKLLDIIIRPKEVNKIDEFQDEEIPTFDFHKENRLPENIELQIDVNAKKILFAKEEWGQTHLNAALDKGAFTINQCDIALSGDGVLSIFGVISQGGDGTLRFEGNMEASGKSLRDSVSMFYSSAKDLPDFVGASDFSISANMYANAQEMRLFEANISVDGTPVFGTMTIFLEGNTRIELKVRLKDVNFDQVRDNLRQQGLEEDNKTKEDQTKDAGNPKDKQPVISFNWLRNLHIRIDASVYIEGFTLLERKGDRASFALYAYRGDLRLSNGQFSYPDGTNEINVSLDVRGARPYVGLMLSADRLDTSYFTLGNGSDAADDASVQEDGENQDAKKDYASSPIPLEWMDYFNGVFDITLQKFTHKNIFMERIKLQARLDNRILNIQKLGFIYSRAQSSVTGTVYGGRVPGMLISFTMSNADTYELLEPLIGLKNISGYASLSGTVSTAGWNFREWLQKMDGKFLISSRAIKVQGVNIAGITNVVDVAKSSADVFNNINNILTKGATEFAADGQLNIANGELFTPKLVLRSGLVTGTVKGGIKLDALTGQFFTEFRFPNLAPESVPTLIIQLSGKIDSPDIKVDTASLEDYVAKKNVAR